MARCTPVQRSVLLADTVNYPAAVISNMRTLIVGPDYAVRRYSSVTDDGFVGNYSASVGVVATSWPQLETGETVDTATASVYIVDCLVRYFLENNLAPGAANGAQNGAAPNEIVHNAGATIWAGPTRSVGVVTDVQVGDHIYLSTNDAGANAFETTVRALKYTAGEANILVLDDNLPAALTGAVFFNVNVDQVVPEQALVAADFTASATTIAVDAAVTVTTTRTGSAKPVYGGTGYSKVYTSYRALRQDNVENVLSITNSSQLSTYFVGWQYPESGLGFALARALAPHTATTVAPAVLGAAIASDDTAGWTNAISRLKRRVDWYTVAPLTQDTANQAIVTGALDDRVALGLPSRAVLCIPLTTTETLWSETVAAVISGGNLTVTTPGEAAFAGAIPGDIVTLDVGNRVIATVVSNQEVTVTASAVGATEVTTVTHPLTIDEQTADFGARVQLYAGRDISVIFPPEPTWNGEEVDGTLYAAAVAGLRGFAVPQRSLRSVQMETGWAVPQATYDFVGELVTLADYGCFVSEDVDGTACVAYANTTDQSTTETRTEGVVANIDALSRYFNDLVACYAGRTKVTTDTLTAIRNAASTGGELLKTQTSVTDIGAIVQEVSVSPAYQDTVNLDTVIVPVTAVVAANLETVSVDIAVTLEVV